MTTNNQENTNRYPCLNCSSSDNKKLTMYWQFGKGMTTDTHKVDESQRAWC